MGDIHDQALRRCTQYRDNLLKSGLNLEEMYVKAANQAALAKELLRNHPGYFPDVTELTIVRISVRDALIASLGDKRFKEIAKYKQGKGLRDKKNRFTRSKEGNLALLTEARKSKEATPWTNPQEIADLRYLISEGLSYKEVTQLLDHDYHEEKGIRNPNSVRSAYRRIVLGKK